MRPITYICVRLGRTPWRFLWWTCLCPRIRYTTRHDTVIIMCCASDGTQLRRTGQYVTSSEVY